MQEKLIAIDDLIKEARKAGIDFGKTDPYNRLRYYTKIGLLPHMERRKSKTGELIAHYPATAYDDLIKIETLKSRGMNNDDIAVELTREKNSLKKAFLSNLTRRNVMVSVLVLAMFALLLNQRGVISLSKDISQQIPATADSSTFNVIDSGVGILRAGKLKTFVRTKNVTELSQIQIAFKDSIQPASTYYVTEKVPEEGFILTLDNNTASDSEFSWWIVRH